MPHRIAAGQLGQMGLRVRWRAPIGGAFDDGPPGVGPHEHRPRDHRPPGGFRGNRLSGFHEQRGAQDVVFQGRRHAACGEHLALQHLQRRIGPAGTQVRDSTGIGRGRKPEAGDRVGFLREGNARREEPGEPGQTASSQVAHRRSARLHVSWRRRSVMSFQYNTERCL